MIFPDKLVAFNKSILAKSVFILKILEVQSMPVSELFILSKKYYEDISEFLIALDVLYILEKVDFNKEMRVIEYVRNDLL